MLTVSTLLFQGKDLRRRAQQCMEQRINWYSMRCKDFALKHPQIPASSTLTQSIPSTATAQSTFLAKWLADNSWTTCDNCMCLLPNPLLPKGNILKRFLPTCACSTSTTLLPTFDMFHDTLRCLSMQDQQILLPFRFDGGPLRLQQHGYRVKISGFDLLTKQTSVWDQIQAVKVENRRHVLEQAYTHLMSRNDSHYSHFIHLCNSHTLQQNYTFNKTFRLPFVETAIWPVLYHRDDFCEFSIVQSDSSRHFKKRQFIHKCLFPILDFSSLFDLLHFQYDR